MIINLDEYVEDVNTRISAEIDGIIENAGSDVSHEKRKEIIDKYRNVIFERTTQYILDYLDEQFNYICSSLQNEIVNDSNNK